MNAITATTQRISIAMATYNGAKYLLDQLDSLAAQTLMPYELVVTDDGSTDATLEILDEFARRAPFPVHIHRNPERLGYRDNFLKAARLCTGDLIAFCDQDDVWMSDKLLCVARVFADDNLLLVLHDALAVTEQLKTVAYIRTPDYAMPFSVQFGFTMVFRADLPFGIKIDRPPSERDAGGAPLAHDQWISFLAYSLGKCHVIREPLVLYRQHGNNTCGFGGVTDARHLGAEVAVAQPARYLHLSTHARERARTLRALIATAAFSEPSRIKAEASLAGWERYAKLLLLRVEINAGKASFMTRQKHFLPALFQLGYSRKYLGHKALLKDAFVTVFGTKTINQVLMLIK
jgi:glycosyltransferase involved in cell wall biosynthesis